jgi:1,4-alpha-glucan branching enzyme
MSIMIFMQKTAKAEKAEARSEAVRHDVTRLGDQDLYLFNEGSHVRLYDKLGSHPMVVDGVKGTYFAVWAPNAERVSVIGDWNGWDRGKHVLGARGSSGIWEGWVPGVKTGAIYKYHIQSRHHGYKVDKADPFARQHEVPPRTASVVSEGAVPYTWNDQEWMATRRDKNALDGPMNVYEVHLGSWRRVPEEGNRSLSYRELAPLLAEYVAGMGFTHVELLPVMEHPFFGSWGYQTTGYFAPTSRFGSAADFAFLVDTLHQHGVGVILDWVPSHFPSDEHGLAFFDGTHLFEHSDPRQGYHPDWASSIFNYSRHEVRSFLLSSALYWLDQFHADGLRVDAVASMLYLDYSRKEGEWIPNEYGGRENIPAITFLRRLNEEVYKHHPDVQTIAEESTAWPMVARPTSVGGLGFGLKWDMGWMHDTLKYFQQDPVHRKYHHDKLTFRFLYAFNENFKLPLSHDEVVHGKGSLLGKMPGDPWQQFANLRLLYGLMNAEPGKKLLFMGAEFGQGSEWKHDESLEWHVLQYPFQQGVQRCVRDLNVLVASEPALHECDFDPSGFEWIDCRDYEQSIISFVRKARSSDTLILVVCNMTPVPRLNYRVGAPRGGFWAEVLNTDAKEYGGSGHGNLGGVEAVPVAWQGRSHSVTLTIPPLGCLFLRSTP